ncbi:unnamed protein product [Adineta ricciae]|uniref:Endonuclease/exonuclease/phosphatase domain-containing protein n=2 Tax=Adineta ricciae TaxID=249248 RepID=A0A814PTQ5_ADIRI|nr:unnamed protein product [Adineta ricciae]
MSRRQLTSFQWNGTEWSSFDGSSNLHNEENEITRIATFNVLADCFPWFIEMAIQSNHRFEWLCNEIIKLNPTILGLNEVTPSVLERLQKCSFIRENYFLTESVDENIDRKCVNGLLVPHGCLILSKLPVLEVFGISFTDSRREAIVVKVQLDKTPVHFCSQHTTAYQRPKNAKLRAGQIRDIVDVLQPFGLPFVIMGDLNLHYNYEDSIAIEHEFIDAWAQTHFARTHPFNDGQPGYTFDARKNTLIPYYIPGECRQMRLDRILFSKGFPAFAIAPCMLWANEPIKAEHYLFTSDHFGLCIDVVPTADENQTEVISLGECDPSADEHLRRNIENDTDRGDFQIGFARRSMALTSHLLWLGAKSVGLR